MIIQYNNSKYWFDSYKRIDVVIAQLNFSTLVNIGEFSARTVIILLCLFGGWGGVVFLSLRIRVRHFVLSSSFLETHKHKSVSLSKCSIHFPVNILSGWQVCVHFILSSLACRRTQHRNTTRTQSWFVRSCYILSMTLQALRNRTAHRQLRKTC